jgi:hypothetical protein
MKELYGLYVKMEADDAAEQDADYLAGEGEQGILKGLRAQVAANPLA